MFLLEMIIIIITIIIIIIHVKHSFSGADTGGVDRVDIHPPFFSKKKIRNVTLFEIENKERKKN